MCCIRQKSRRSQAKTLANQNGRGGSLGNQTGTQSETQTNPTTPKRAIASKPKTLLSEMTAKPAKPKVHDVHRRILSCEGVERKKSTAQHKQREMEEAMQMLGCSMINTTIIDRVEKANNQAGEKSHYSAKAGDEKFPLASNRSAGKKDDDTVTPFRTENTAGTPRNEDEREVELVEDNIEEEPNSENYMYNTREIKYVNIDMIRNIDKNVIMEATGDPVLEGAGEKIEWDPMAPLSVLMARPLFDCTNLRRNTFITSAQSYPSKEELDKKGKVKVVHKKPHVLVIERSKKIQKFKPENSIRTTVTATLESIEKLDKTPPSKTEETPMVKSNKAKKA